jgi:hypothetical protein
MESWPRRVTRDCREAEAKSLLSPPRSSCHTEGARFRPPVGHARRLKEGSMLYRRGPRHRRYVLQIAAASGAATILGFTACLAEVAPPVRANDDAAPGSSSGFSGSGGSGSSSGFSGSGGSGSSSGFAGPSGSSGGSGSGSSSGIVSFDASPAPSDATIDSPGDAPSDVAPSSDGPEAG